ncbi:MAG TPA: PIG-L family deacetylase [Chloroflexi bacterium]|nr:PIG-L family deacetylase [Chloroflexota bacterium]HPO59486.1 PIG-L family deacetylase [Anaerolineaceae bacterium]
MRVLAFFAHPDDETILIGGTLALLARLGAEVHYLIATRGEGGEVGGPPVCERSQLGLVRSRELECAVKALGGASLTFMDYIDPLVGPDDELYPFAEDTAEVQARLARKADRLRPDVLITHGSNGEYGHPGHLQVYQAARNFIVQRMPREPLWYTVNAAFPDHPNPHGLNEDGPAHLIIDVTAALEQKTQAALCHRSQHALFVRRRSKEAGRQLSVPEVVRNVESLHRAWPPVINGRLDDILAWLLLERAGARRGEP